MKRSIKELFWDYEIKERDFKALNEEIVIRILNYGDLEDWRWLFNKIGKRKLVKIIKNNKNLIRKNIFKLLSIFLDIKRNKNASSSYRKKK